MQLEYAKNPVWANAEHTMIDLMVKWDAINEELPFSASPNDSEAHGRDIYEAAAAGQYGVVAEYVPYVPSPEDVKAARITELKQLLADSDYKVLPDYDKTTDAIKTQRQAWRDEVRTLEQA